MIMLSNLFTMGSPYLVTKILVNSLICKLVNGPDFWFEYKICYSLCIYMVNFTGCVTVYLEKFGISINLLPTMQ
jgi:succinate dehydrogenase/fumarate reductase cytochrome b subunit